MIGVRPGRERGFSRNNWLDSRHTFSFADYYDPRYMGFSVLRVINEDRVAPGAGFPTHGHRDMEIISYVLEGALEHRDSLGTGSVIRAGEFQRMSAGAGVTHSEYNASQTQPVHFLQIWILPRTKGLAPSYEQRSFADGEGLMLVASPDGGNDSLTIHQDAFLYRARLSKGGAVEHPLAPDRKAYVQVAKGKFVINGVALAAGDGAVLSGERLVRLSAEAAGETLLFDLP